MSILDKLFYDGGLSSTTISKSQKNVSFFLPVCLKTNKNESIMINFNIFNKKRFVVQLMLY
jgi:hypothetical protein